MQKSPSNILIIKPSSLGDIILALPAMADLRKSFPHAVISWLVRPEFAPLLAGHPYLNHIIHFDRKFLGKWWYNPRAFASLVKLITLLRREKFDAVFDFQGLLRTALLAWLSGCKNRFGMAEAREFAHIFYNYNIPQQVECVHVVDYYRKMVAAGGANTVSVEFFLPGNSDAEEQVHRLLRSSDIKSDNYAVLVPASAHADKCWPVERFATLANKISSDFGLSIVAVGTSAEKAIVQRLKTLTSAPVIDLAGQTTIPQLVALLRKARLVISNDTGPGHIAAALGVPLVMIFGPSNPVRVAPYGRMETVAAVEPEGRGDVIRSNEAKYGIDAVTVEQVYEKACRQIQKTGMGHSPVR